MCSLLCVHCVGYRASEALSCLNQSRVTQGTRRDYNCSVWPVSNLRRVCSHVLAHLFLLVWMWNMSADSRGEKNKTEKVGGGETNIQNLLLRDNNRHELFGWSETNGLCIQSRHSQWTKIFTRRFSSFSKNLTSLFIASEYFTLNVTSHSSRSLSVPLLLCFIPSLTNSLCHLLYLFDTHSNSRLRF